MKKTLVKVLTIIAAVLVIAIAVTATTLALVKTNFNQVVDTSRVQGVTIYTDSKDDYYAATDKGERKKVFDNILSLYNKGTKETVMSSLFQGAYSKKAEPKLVKETMNVTEIKKPAAGSYVVKFDLADEDRMQLKVDGEAVIDNSKYGSDKNVYYNSAYVVISNNESLATITSYVVSDSNSNYSYYQVKFIAHHSELFNYISSLEIEG